MRPVCVRARPPAGRGRWRGHRSKPRGRARRRSVRQRRQRASAAARRAANSRVGRTAWRSAGRARTARNRRRGGAFGSRPAARATGPTGVLAVAFQTTNGRAWTAEAASRSRPASMAGSMACHRRDCSVRAPRRCAAVARRDADRGRRATVAHHRARRLWTCCQSVGATSAASTSAWPTASISARKSLHQHPTPPRRRTGYRRARRRSRSRFPASGSTRTPRRWRGRRGADGDRECAHRHHGRSAAGVRLDPDRNTYRTLVRGSCAITAGLPGHPGVVLPTSVPRPSRGWEGRTNHGTVPLSMRLSLIAQRNHNPMGDNDGLAAQNVGFWRRFGGEQCLQVQRRIQYLYQVLK